MNHCYISWFSLFVCLFSITLSFGLEMGVRAVYSLLLSCGFQELRCLPAKLSHWPLTGPCCWPGTLSISGCPQTKPFWLCLLAQPPKIWDYRHALPTPACCIVTCLCLCHPPSPVCAWRGGGVRGQLQVCWFHLVGDRVSLFHFLFK